MKKPDLKTVEADGIRYMPLVPDKELARQVVATYQDGWSRGGKPAIFGGDALYFFKNFNDPAWIIEQAERMQDARTLEELPLIWYVAESEGMVLSSGALMFNHKDMSVEKGRGVTRHGVNGKGIFKTLSEVLMSQIDGIGYLTQADTNTMHKATQSNCENNLGMPAVGFMPLKYKIPTAHYWTDVENSDVIFWDGRVSVVHNVGYSGTKRNPMTFVDERASALRQAVLSKVGLYDSCASKTGRAHNGVIQGGTEDLSALLAEDDSVCGWMKIKANGEILPVSRLLEAASETGKAYIEVDLPATEKDLAQQSSFLDHGFIPMSYMPGFFPGKNGDGRIDGLKLGYVVNRGLFNSYLDTMTTCQLGRVVVPSALPIAELVLDYARGAR
ncbi:MAG: hypothetical protein HGA85_01275 [Nanoarchaeota archaeon]|nr:hypothetical protein [Nanoarchaeota archaeon]